MQPLSLNMRLSVASTERLHGGVLTQYKIKQLNYADMLIDVSKNLNSQWCQV